jgi:LCP family protein required for cell wall assembly
MTSRIVRGVAVAASAGVLVFSTFGWWAADHYIGEVGHETVFGSDPGDPDPQARPTVDPAAGDSMNILLVGSDTRDGLTDQQKQDLHVGHLNYGLHTDTMELIHIGKDTSHISVIGFPRDSVVDIPKCTDPDTGAVHGAIRTRINEAFARGGGKCMVKTVENATGIKIDHYVEVSFVAFLGMVEAIGGVDVCLARPLKDNQKYTGLDLPAGRSTLQGAMALNFVRARHIDSDFGRIQRQQQFIASMFKKATSTALLTNPLKLNDFISAALKNTKVDETLDKQGILDLTARVAGIKFSSIEFPKIPITSGSYTEPTTGQRDLVKWDEAGAQKLFDEIKADLPITQQAAGKAPVATVAPGSIRVQVFNGTATPGLGKQVTTALAGLGYLTKTPKAAPTTTYTTTVIRYDASFTESVKTLAATFPGATLKAVPGLGRTFQVIVGSRYTGVTKPKVSTSAKTDAVVASDVVCAV